MKLIKEFLKSKLILIGVVMACSGVLPGIVNTLNKTAGSGIVFTEQFAFVSQSVSAILGCSMLFFFKCFLEKQQGK